MGFAKIGAILLACLSVTAAHARDIAITLDDLPFITLSQTSPEQGLAIVTAVNQTLAAHGITATGFVVGNQICRQTRPALDAFVQAGHSIGNHSWSHPDYDTLTARGFRRETRRTHNALTPWLGNTRFYRFPYLREGATAQARQTADDILSDLGYVNVPVTIDNEDWKFNADYVSALAAGDAGGAQDIADSYIAHMQNQTLHFEALAKTGLGREVKHILLLHMNQINADHLHRLLDSYTNEGWTFITVEHAMTDPLYTAPEPYQGARGLSQIERVMGRASDE